MIKFRMESQFWTIAHAITTSDMMKRIPVIQRECMKRVLVFVYTFFSKYRLSVFFMRTRDNNLLFVRLNH